MLSTLFLALSLNATPTTNWPQFRGPTGDGVALTVSSRIDDAGDAQGVAE